MKSLFINVTHTHILVYLVTVAKAVPTARVSLIGTESIPPHRLRHILLHTGTLLHSHTIVTINGRHATRR